MSGSRPSSSLRGRDKRCMANWHRSKTGMLLSSENYMDEKSTMRSKRVGPIHKCSRKNSLPFRGNKSTTYSQNVSIKRRSQMTNWKKLRRKAWLSTILHQTMMLPKPSRSNQDYQSAHKSLLSSTLIKFKRISAQICRISTKRIYKMTLVFQISVANKISK